MKEDNIKTEVKADGRWVKADKLSEEEKD
jgi:hypothetical protein